MIFPVGSAARASMLVGMIGALASVAAPAFGGPPFRTDDPEPVDFQHFEINMFSLGTRTSSGWNGLLPALEVNYGALPNLQLHIATPLGYNVSGGGRAGFAGADLELGAKYHFITPADGDWFPQVAVFPMIEVPTGNQKLGCVSALNIDPLSRGIGVQN